MKILIYFLLNIRNTTRTYFLENSDWKKFIFKKNKALNHQQLLFHLSRDCCKLKDITDSTSL